MKKSLFFLSLSLFGLLLNIPVFAESNFAHALRTCEPYLLDGSLVRNGQKFNIAVTLEKSKKKKTCIYKEKIYQGIEYQMLTCNINYEQLPQLADLMDKHYNEHKAEIMKEKIFEAKMTSNEDILKTYLTNTNFCNITYSSRTSVK